MKPTPGQESMPDVRMTGTRQHHAFMTCNGFAFTVPKECGPQIGLAVSSYAALVKACEARLKEWHDRDANILRLEPPSVRYAREALALAKGQS